MNYYERCYKVGADVCMSILNNNGINPGNVDPCVELAEAIEFKDVDEIDLIIEESSN